MFVYLLPSILTFFSNILIENLSNPIRINTKFIYFACLGSLAGLSYLRMALKRALLCIVFSTVAAAAEHGHHCDGDSTCSAEEVTPPFKDK